MGYTKNTFKTATALDYAQIDHYNRSLKDSSIAPLDTSAVNLSKFQNQKLGEGQGYRLTSGYIPPSQNETTMNEPIEDEKPISRLEVLAGDKFENKAMFEESQLASRPSYNPADDMISPRPDFDVPLDASPPQQDKLGGLITSNLA